MPSTTVDLFAPATAMLQALRQRQVSATELLTHHLDRIAQCNPALNVIVEPDYDQAREAAVAADVLRARGEDRPLLGLPITVKESFDMRGLRTTVGLEILADARAAADGPFVTRLRTAGAVLMGKTNVPPKLVGYHPTNPIYGRTNNPWNLGRTPGGSTAGAAAVAAGLTPLEFGNDLGGSIRVPATFCGIYGHKTSETAVPRSGLGPAPAAPNWATAMPVIGPLARSAEDLELALDRITGPDVGEDTAWRLELPPARHTQLAEFRVAVLPPVAWLPVDREVEACLDTLAGRLSQVGARVAVAQPELFGDLRHHHRLYLSLRRALATREPADARRAEATTQRATGDEFAIAWADGLEASVFDYLGWHDRREQYRSAFRTFFGDWDILLAPVTLTPAPPHTDLPVLERTVEVNGQAVPFMQELAYPAIATLSGQPATAFPTSRSRDGLPIGLQAIGPYLEDRTTIRFAALLEQAYGGFVPPPEFAL